MAEPCRQCPPDGYDSRRRPGRRRFHRHRLAGAERARAGGGGHAGAGDGRGGEPGLPAELRRQEPADAQDREDPGDRAGHLQPVLQPGDPGRRGGRARRRLFRAAGRHPSRGRPRGGVRRHAAAARGRRADLPGSPAAGRPGADGGGARTAHADRQRLRVQPGAGGLRRAHRQRAGRGRGDGAPVRAGPSSGGRGHGPAGQPAQPRPAGRRTPRGRARRPSRLRRSSASATKWRWEPWRRSAGAASPVRATSR